MTLARRSAVARRIAVARRSSVAVRCLFIGFAGVAIGSCGRPAPGPNDASVHPWHPASPSATLAASPPAATRPSPSAAASATVGEVPRILVRLPPTATSGASWWVTEPGHPDRRTPIVVPFADLELGPASADGTFLATTAAQALTIRLDGPALITTSAMPLPIGHTLVPACYAGDGRAVFADAETLSLVTLTDGVVVPFGDVVFALGECAALADRRTVVAIDGGGLVAVDTDGASTPIAGAIGRHLSAGGRRTFMIDPSAEFGQVVVREGTVSKDGSMGPVVGTVAGGPTGRVVDARTSPDGRWLAVVLERETATEPEARLQIYRVGNEGLAAVAETALEVGARISVLADP